MYSIFIVHSFVDGYLGSLQFLSITNREEMNMDDQESQQYDVESFEYMPGGIAVSYINLQCIFRHSH